MKELELSNTKMVALVDNGVYRKALAYSSWHRAKNGYVRSNRGGGSLRHTERQIFLHEIVLGPCPKGKECDHRDLNRLNYRRRNLRYVSRGSNQRHKTLIQSNNTSGFRGAIHTTIRGYGYWVGRIKVDGKVKHLGYFKTAEDAARAYDEAAKKFHGKFATLNFPERRN